MIRMQWKFSIIKLIITFFLYTVAGNMVSGVWGEEVFRLDFKNSQSEQQPLGWLDKDQDIKPEADIFCVPNRNQATIQAANSGGWGTVRYPLVEKKLKQHDILEIQVDRLDPGTTLVVDLYTTQSRKEKIRCGRIFEAGQFQYGMYKFINKMRGYHWGIQLTVEGRPGTSGYSADVNRIRILDIDNPPDPFYRYTADFTEPVNFSPLHWRSGHNYADIRCRQDGRAIITLLKEKQYGDIISPLFQQDELNGFESLLLTIEAISPKTYLVIVLQEEEGDYRAVNLIERISAAGKYKINIGTLLAKHNIAKFSIKIWINGKPGKSFAILNTFNMLPRLTLVAREKSRLHVEALSIRSKQNQDDMHKKPAKEEIFWEADFIGKAGEQPSQWWDSTNDRMFNTEVKYGRKPATLDIEFGTNNYWGKVLSSNMQCDFKRFPILEITIGGMSKGVKWRLGIQESGGTRWRHWFLQNS